MKTHFTNVGNVRGECGHKHRTAAAAGDCAHRDQVWCQRQGGYSDYQLLEVNDLGRCAPTEDDFYTWKYWKDNRA